MLLGVQRLQPNAMKNEIIKFNKDKKVWVSKFYLILNLLDTSKFVNTI